MPDRLTGLKRAVFARHSNPWSAWTRLLSAPLTLVPVWTRRWSHAAVVGAWLAVNPVAFPPPEDDRAWSTRAMLGEELWIERRPMDAAMAVNAGASLAGLLAMLAARKRRALPAALASTAQLGLLLVYWRQMSDYYERSRATE